MGPGGALFFADRRRLNPMPPQRFAVPKASSALGMSAMPAGLTVVVRMLSATAT